VRHALKPRTTIVIAEKEFKFPFDLGHLLIRPYEHLGSGIDFEEAERLKATLVKAITTIIENDDCDSPVYTFLPGLKPPAFEVASAALEGMHSAAAKAASFSLEAPADTAGQDMVFSVLLESFAKARKEGDFTTARVLIQKIRGLRPRPDGKPSNDPYLVQQHALVTYKSKQPTKEAKVAAFEEALDILRVLEPEKTGDPETLGLWGAIHKRLWEETKDRKALDEGIFSYARGFYIKRDYYTGINYAFMLDDRARMQEAPDERTADRVLARRIRRQVLDIVEAAIAALPKGEDGNAQDPAEKYWLGATRLEALLGLGDPRFEKERAALLATATEPWMGESTDAQLAKLAALLEEGAPAAPTTPSPPA